MEETTKNILKKCLENKNYDKYNKILEKEIINILVKEIQEKDPDYLYSTFIELLEVAESYLPARKIAILKKIYVLHKEETQEDNMAYELMEIYKKIQ